MNIIEMQKELFKEVNNLEEIELSEILNKEEIIEEKKKDIFKIQRKIQYWIKDILYNNINYEDYINR